MAKEGAVSAMIFTEQVLIVIREWRGGSHPEYDVFDQHWRQLAVARRAASRGLRRVLNVVGSVDPGPLQVLDMSEKLLLTAESGREHGRPMTLIRDGDGAEVGKVIRMRGVLKAEFDLQHGGGRIGSVKVADRRQRVVIVNDEAGRPIGEIQTLTEDTPLPVPDGTEGYYLKTHHGLSEPLRSLVVACTIVLQSILTAESMDASFSVTFPGFPALLDRLRRGSRS